MARSPKKLDRLLRVRTLQLEQVRGEEARAVAKVDQEAQLRDRIANLAANVAPIAASTDFARSLAAAANFRDRLHQSAAAADRRVAVAEQSLELARAATREARRDQNAIEKLIDRAEADAALKALRELEQLPPSGRNRHDIC
jgi:flagellar protein FliJ